MHLTEQKNLNERYDFLKRELDKRYSTKIIRGERCYLGPHDKYFIPTLLPSWGTIVIEYAHGIREAVLNQYEDGDMFYLEELDNDTLLREVLQEIED